MKITVHRGTQQIGGCITEIESESGTRIIIDLGHNLPGTPGTDPLDNMQAFQNLISGVSAVVYTHNHGDHVSFFEEVPESIPQYIGPMGKEVLKTLSLRQGNRKRGVNYVQLFHKRNEAIDRMRTYEVAREFAVGDISITPYLVSHSAADSYMLLIRCDGKTVLHTGDFREHGFTGKGLFPTLKKYIVPKKTDILITEGTMLSRPCENHVREYDIQKEMEKLMNSHKYVFIMCSSTNFDRIVAAHNAHCRVNHGLFCCDMYQNDQLKILAEFSGKFHDMYNIDDAQELSLRDKDMIDSMCHDGFTMLVRCNTRFKVWTDIITRMIDLRQAVFIYSQYLGYITPESPAYNSGMHEFVKEQRCQVVYCHTSGHAYADTLSKVCSTINPKTGIIAIHKENGADIKDFLTEDMSRKVIDKDETRDGIEITLR